MSNELREEDLEPAAWSKSVSGDMSYCSRRSAAISLKRIADAFEQLVYFHLGPPDDDHKEK